MLFLTSYPSHYFSNCFSRILKLVLTATHCLFSELCDYIFSYIPLREVCQSFKQMNGSLQWTQEFAARKKKRIRLLRLSHNFSKLQRHVSRFVFGIHRKTDGGDDDNDNDANDCLE